MKTVERWVSGCPLKDSLAARICIQARGLLSTEDLEHLHACGMLTFLDLEHALSEGAGKKPDRLDERTWGIVARYHQLRCNRQEEADAHIAEKTLDRFLGRAA
jgi:hypothetical protein